MQAIVLVTSRNSAKVEAVEAIFSLALGHRVVVVGIDVLSSVSTTPIGDEEAIQGCRNRIEHVRRDHPDIDFLVGLEGAVERHRDGVFVYGWALIEDRQSGRQGLGCSAKVMLPPGIGEKIERHTSLSELATRHYGLSSPDDVASIGTNGIVTNGLFSRRDEFEGALRCALGFLINEKNFS